MMNLIQIHINPFIFQPKKPNKNKMNKSIINKKKIILQEYKILLKINKRKRKVNQ